jgi:MFS family permease
VAVISSVSTTEPRVTAGWRFRLRHRELDRFPAPAARLGFLGLTVAVTISLYYMAYCGGSVSTLQIVDLNMSFHFLIWVTAIGNVLGAVGALFAGVTDRIGRVPVVLVGLTFTGLMTTFALPASPNRWVFAALAFLVGNVEGIVLVATPALIRDFSAQTGRARAMGVWTLGPVIGSLIVSLVGTWTIHGTPSPRFWGHEYVIAGCVGLGVSALAILFLRELAPELRDQLLVSEKDRLLAELKARGFDLERALRHPFRQMLKRDILISGFAVSILLLAYYTAIGLGSILLQIIFGFNLQQANSLGNWIWGINAVTVVAAGFLSDGLRVRKPLMVAGAVVAAVSIVLYLSTFGHHTSYLEVALLVSALSFGLGLAYTPWMASYTETCEAHNPALTATGLAVWGLTIRGVVFFMLIALPAIITTVTPLVNFAVRTSPYTNAIVFAGEHPALVSQVEANAAQLGALASLEKTDPGPLAAAAAGRTDPATRAFEAAHAGVLVWAAEHRSLIAQATANQPELALLARTPPKVLAYAAANGTAVLKDEKAIPGQSQRWYWVCFAGAVGFIGGVPLLRGRWRPRRAREDMARHEAMVQAELDRLAPTEG